MAIVGEIKDKFDGATYNTLISLCDQANDIINSISPINNEMLSNFAETTEYIHTSIDTNLAAGYDSLINSWQSLSDNISSMSQYILLVKAATDNIAAAGNIAGRNESQVTKYEFANFKPQACKFEQPDRSLFSKYYDEFRFDTDNGMKAFNNWQNNLISYKAKYQSVRDILHEIINIYSNTVRQLDIVDNISKFSNNINANFDDIFTKLDQIRELLNDETQAKAQTIYSQAESANVSIDEITSGPSIDYNNLHS